jgi:hypothetical protein
MVRKEGRSYLGIVKVRVEVEAGGKGAGALFGRDEIKVFVLGGGGLRYPYIFQERQGGSSGRLSFCFSLSLTHYWVALSGKGDANLGRGRMSSKIGHRECLPNGSSKIGNFRSRRGFAPMDKGGK